MSAETTGTAVPTGEIEALRRELSRLAARLDALEKAATAPPAVPAPAATATAPPAEGLDEELIVVLGAAVAAFLGKRPHIRQIRLLGSAAWSEQGRVTIQASHALSHHKA